MRVFTQCICAHSGIAANGLLAVLAGVGVEALVTFHAIGILLSQDVLLPEEGFFAVVAVVAVRHFHPRPIASHRIVVKEIQR